MTTADWIKRRRELLAAATPGPWVTTADGVDTLSAGLNPDGHLCLYAGFGWDDDAALIADARTSLPLALEALDYLFSDELSLNDPPYAWESGDGWSSGWEEAVEDIRERVTSILLRGCRECRQIDGHHKLDCGRRS